MLMDFRSWRTFLLRVFALGLGFGFLFGVFQISGEEKNIKEKMDVFYFSLPIGVLVSLGFGFIVERFFGGKKTMDRWVIATLFLYLGFLKIFGGGLIFPMISLFLSILVGVFFVVFHFRIRTGKFSLLLHGMGYMSGIYLFLHLEEYLKSFNVMLENFGLIFRWILS